MSNILIEIKMKGLKMKFDYKDLEIIENDDNLYAENNAYTIISKSPDVAEEDISRAISIIDENGQELSCTYTKFLEIFDEQGLSGFIM